MNHESSSDMAPAWVIGYPKGLYLFSHTEVHDIRPKLTTQMRHNSMVMEHDAIIILMAPGKHIAHFFNHFYAPEPI
jgi:hypothetical protein